MLQQVKSCKGLFIELFQKGQPSFWGDDGKMISQYEYWDLLVKTRLDHKKFEYMSQTLSGKVIVDKLAMDFEIVDSFKMIGAMFTPNSYVDHVDLRELDKYMENIEVPSRDQWHTIENFAKMKYILHQ